MQNIGDPTRPSALNPPAAFLTYAVSNDVIKKIIVILVTVEFKCSSQPGREIHDILYTNKPLAPFIPLTLFPLLPINI